ncbi:FAD-dependent oxidoreductase [Aspergillus stella-maris]|uniref:FAD-dependent oxidoreductase n=1 Tax=Aspergillus stella-maris TaxID=1810926 RepID=UPI003CCD132A
MSLCPDQSKNLLAADLSAAPNPLHTPTQDSPRILIIGAGVTGLATAWLALDCGYNATMLSSEWASFGQGPRLPSQIAGALWEIPPAGCGPQAVQGKLAMWNESLREAFGVQMRTFTSFHTNSIDDDEVKTRTMELLKRTFGHVERGDHLFAKYGVNRASHGGLQEAYEHEAPIIDTDVAMAFLTDLVRRKGAELVTDTVYGNILDQESELLKTYSADAIVNATGVWARDIAPDTKVYCLRGGLLRITNDGMDFPKINNAMIVSSETKFDGNFQDRWELDLTPDSEELLEMRRRCEDLLPCLRHAKVDPAYSLAQGRRPMRQSHVRVEREEGSRIVHSYGHGGAGWSLAFGSARETLRLVGGILSENNLRMLKPVLRSRY